MHRLLHNRDILDEIFSWLSLNDLASTITVNHCWFQASVPKLWKKVSLATILSTLGPIEELAGGHHKFVSPLEAENWKRFLLYAVHVQTLEGSKRYELALKTALNSFAYHSNALMEDGIQYLLPACRDLKYKTSCRHEFLNIDPLISPNLEHFRLKSINFDPIWFNRLCEILITRVPSLRAFHLSIFNLSNEEAALSMDSLQQLLKHFASSLSFLHIPRVLVDESTIERVGDIRNLAGLIINDTNISFQPSVLPGYTERNGNGGLTSLQALVFGSDIPLSLFHTFCDRFTFSSLGHLTWFFGEDFDDAILTSFVANVVRTCPMLRVLDIGRSRKFDSTDNLSTVKWSTMRPLLDCKYLDALSVHCFMVAMTPDQFLELLKSRRSPGWQILELFTEEPLPLQTTLLLMTQYCPFLQALGIHTDVQELDAYSLILFPHVLEEGKVPVEYSFPSLSSIDFGHSTFAGYDTPVQVALFLFALCSTPRSGLEISGWDVKFCRDVVGCMKAAVEFSQRRHIHSAESLEAEVMPEQSPVETEVDGNSAD